MLSALLADDAERWPPWPTCPLPSPDPGPQRRPRPAAGPLRRHARSTVRWPAGTNLSTALEVALKIKETTRLGAHPLFVGRFPPRADRRRRPGLPDRGGGALRPHLRGHARPGERADARGADQIIISDQALAQAQTPLRLPAGMPSGSHPLRRWCRPPLAAHLGGAARARPGPAPRPEQGDGDALIARPSGGGLLRDLTTSVKAGIMPP